MSRVRPLPSGEGTSRIRLAVSAPMRLRAQTPVIIADSPPDPPADPSMRSSVSQRGVSFTFDAPRQTGQFVNGDWWVVEPTAGAGVTLTSVTPDAFFDGSTAYHGMMVNPTGRLTHGYTSRLASYNPAENRGLMPQTIAANSSAIKAVAPATSASPVANYPVIDDHVVLTVLAAAPPANAFRPPFFGTDKRIFTTDNIDLTKLPSLTPPAGVTPVTLAAVKRRFAGPQVDHVSSYTFRQGHSAYAFASLVEPGLVSNYGGDLARDNVEAIQRLMLNDPLADKLPALYNVLQAGIDWYGMSKGGVRYWADGGIFVGRKVPVVFAAVMFDDADMKTVAGNTTEVFSEVGHIYRSPATGMVLHGKIDQYGHYDQVRTGTGGGSRDLRDPHNIIDGGETPAGPYGTCCSASVYVGSALIALLLPGGKAVWNHPEFFEFADRWQDHGIWSAPDTLMDGTVLGRLFAGGTRTAASYHGTSKGQYGYTTDFQILMWQAHRASAGPLSYAVRT